MRYQAAFVIAAAAILPFAAAQSQRLPIHGDAAACSEPGQPAVLARISGFRNGVGVVRVQAYGPRAQDFLQTGRYASRVEVPLNGQRTIDVCLKLPVAGQYGIAVRHDANASGSSDWNDGGGFSRNPKLSLLKLKPGFDAVAIPVGTTASRIGIVMNYRNGLSIGPARGG